MPPDADFRPAITRNGRVARLAFVVAVGVLVGFGAYQRGAFDDRRWLLAVDLVAGAVAWIAVGFRRRWPLPVAVGSSVLTAVSATATGPAALAMMSLATGLNTRRILIAALVNVAAAIVNTTVVLGGDLSEPDELVGVLVPLAAMIGWGMYVGVHRDLVGNLRLRAERAEAEQEFHAREARATERTRIAREMHDVVAHRISQVSMRAGALAFRSDLPADEMRVESEVIRDAANEALRELRSVLHVLRDPASGELVDPPQPTYADIARLIDGARTAGTEVTFVDSVTEPVSNETGRTIYRVVQEGVTNARKHAPRAVISVEIDNAPDHESEMVVVCIVNDLVDAASAPPGSGLGLLGISERVALAGGRFEHGEVDGQFVLRAWLQRTPASLR